MTDTGRYPTVPEWTVEEYLSAILAELRKLNAPPKIQYVPSWTPPPSPAYPWQTWN